MRQQIKAIAKWSAFGIMADIGEKVLKISPATIDRTLKKDRAALALKGKSLANPLLSPKSRIPIRAFYSEEERKTSGFRQTDTVELQPAATADRSLPVSTSSP
jgi:hypothetical protein